MAIKIAGTEVISDDKRILNNESLPDIRPSLLLDFANSKTLDPRITFTRGSTATYWDGKTTAKAEENLLKYSQEFDNGYWTNAGLTITSDNTTAPDGTTTAELLTTTTSAAPHLFFKNGVITLGSTAYTLSIYAKANTFDYVVLSARHNSGSVAQATFNVSTGAVSSTANNTADGTIDGTDIIDVGNGWYRCILKVTMPSTNNADQRYGVSPSDGTSTNAGYYDGSTSGSIYAWGAQLEERSSATAYTPTTSSPIVKYQPVLQTAASGEARFDHDPVTGESKGLLIEEARTNSVTQSVYSNNNNVIITTDATTAPDGTQTGILIQENTSNALHRGFSTALLPAANTRYTFSIYMKNYEGSPNERYFYLNLGSTINAAIGLDLSTMTINTTNGTGSPVSSIEEVGNGWYRLVLTGTSSASPVSNQAWYTFRTTTGTGDQTYTGDGFSGFYIWGAQFEQGSFPTSYIPTSGSTVTRAVDIANMTGTNFSSWYSEGAYSFYCDTQPYSGSMTEDGQFRRLLSFSDGSTSNTVQLVGVGNADVLRLERIYAGTFTSLTSPAVPSGSFDYAATVTSGDQQTYIGGNESGNNTVDGAFPSVSKLNIGSNGANGQAMCGHIKKLAYYPKRLPNATLQAMTEA